MAKAKSKTATKAKPVAKKKAAKPAPKAKKPAATKKPVPPAKKPQKNAPPPVKKAAPKPVQKPAPKKPAAKKATPPKAVVPAKPEKAPAKQAAPKSDAKAPVAPKPAAAPVAKAQPAPKPAPAKAAKPGKVSQPIIAVMAGVEPIGGPAKVLKRAMKERFSMEFYLRATPSSLYDLISTPSGFSEWFCDDVDVRGDMFSFRWGSDVQVAECLGRKAGELMRFQWTTEEDPGAWFELRIRIDPMTNETCLVVTDHAWPKDMDEAKALWDSQIHTLQRVLGA